MVKGQYNVEGINQSIDGKTYVYFKYAGELITIAIPTKLFKERHAKQVVFK